MIRPLLKALKFFVFENVYTSPINIDINRPIFTFTFDDAPVSALTVGADILDSYNVKATYYIALGMNSGKNNHGDYKKYIDSVDIKFLHDRGHDIGCHTYSHLNLRETEIGRILSDCKKNTDELQQILGTKSIDHFAYPFGMVSLSGKKVLGKKYKTLRTTDHGVNYGLTDLTHLRAVSLCSNTFDRHTIKKVIEEGVKNNAWVIFFTHDIKENPSRWGTNTGDFEWVVKQCLKQNADVLNTRQAFNKIASQTNS